METKNIYLFATVCAILLHFGYSFEKFENISDCKTGSLIPNMPYPIPYELTMICGTTDNTSDIFGQYETHCSNRYVANEYIRKINFENCLFRDINNEYFKNFTRLREFDTSDVNLTTITIKEPPKSPFLTWFNASHNQLTTLPSDIFCSIKSLMSLDVSHNAIVNIGSINFDCAVSLTVLNVSYNQSVTRNSIAFVHSSKKLKRS